MKSEKPPPKIEDIELIPDSWDRFVEAVKKVARHPPVDHPTGHGKQQSKPRKRRAIAKRPI
jgi:hypothetical protein